MELLFKDIVQQIRDLVFIVAIMFATKHTELSHSMKKFLFLAIFLICNFITPIYADGLTLFSEETSAQSHCPHDEVVWLNLPTGIWHKKGARWYGATKRGAYVCKQEAASVGDRQSLNGS